MTDPLSPVSCVPSAPPDAEGDKGAYAHLWNDDPRLAESIPVALRATTLGTCRLADILQDAHLGPLLLECTEAVNEELERHRRQTLEETARELLTRADAAMHDSQAQSGRRRVHACRAQTLEALALRYGILGGPPITLEEMGGILGVTRERARQIQKLHEELPRSVHPSWPQLDRALELATTMSPCTEEELAQVLIARGITSGRYQYESLTACAAFAGRQIPAEASDGLIGVSGGELSEVLRAARALAGRQGLATPVQISDELLDRGVVMSEHDVRTHLRFGAQIAWLDDQHITWSDQVRNRLVNTLRTMLSVHQPVDLDSATKAVARFWTYRNAGRTDGQADLVAPTLEGLRAFVQWHPDFEVIGDGKLLRSTTPLEFSEETGLEAAMLVEVIRSMPDQATDRVALAEAAEAMGMKATTVGVYLSYHPAFVSPAQNVWTVLGTDLTQECVERIRTEARQRSRDEVRDFETGSTQGGNAWVAWAATSSFRMSGVLLRRWLPLGNRSARLAATDGQGNPCGNVVYNADSGFTHGLSTYVRRFDVRVGEYLLLVADLQWETAQIVHGHARLLSGPEGLVRPS
jgi:hypothetical protein